MVAKLIQVIGIGQKCNKNQHFFFTTYKNLTKINERAAYTGNQFSIKNQVFFTGIKSGKNSRVCWCQKARPGPGWLGQQVVSPFVPVETKDAKEDKAPA